jgi:hypothetical protein
MERETDEQLVASYASPILTYVHTPGRKQQLAAIRSLNAEQGAVFILWFLYIHARNGLSGFCQEKPHHIASPGFWTFLRIGLRHIHDSDFLQLVDRWRTALEPTLTAAGFDPEPSSAEPQTDLATLSRIQQATAELDANTLAVLDADYLRLIPTMLHRLAERIRNQPQAFALMR